jgi:regulator of protease activity HflC (stomatin/prohibitin superfamily)
MNTPNTGTQEIDFKSYSGYLALLVALAALVALPLYLHFSIEAGSKPNGLVVVALGSLLFFILKGIYILQPNQSSLLMLFGSYRGTDYATGLRWANPLFSKKKISLRLRNFNSEKMKVNDKRGNPIEIAAAIVWRVSDTARANEYAYDHVDEADETLTLRAGGDEIISKLKRQLQERFAKAGLLVEDARLTHLAYAPEIAGAMLRRQQAEAVIGARKQIVLGAVSMVEMALQGLTERGVVELDTERRAAMVSNLLVVLCAETEAQPVINAGTLYS